MLQNYSIEHKTIHHIIIEDPHGYKLKTKHCYYVIYGKHNPTMIEDGLEKINVVNLDESNFKLS